MKTGNESSPNEKSSVKIFRGGGWVGVTSGGGDPRGESWGLGFLVVGLGGGVGVVGVLLQKNAGEQIRSVPR